MFFVAAIVFKNKENSKLCQIGRETYNCYEMLNNTDE